MCNWERRCVTEILSKVGSAMNEPIDDTDSGSCHHGPMCNAGRSHITVQFKCRTVCDTVLKTAKKKAPLTNNDLGLENTAPICVNGHPCPAQKKLLAVAARRKM